MKSTQRSGGIFSSSLPETNTKTLRNPDCLWEENREELLQWRTTINGYCRHPTSQRSRLSERSILW